MGTKTSRNTGPTVLSGSDITKLWEANSEDGLMTEQKLQSCLKTLSNSHIKEVLEGLNKDTVSFNEFVEVLKKVEESAPCLSLTESVKRMTLKDATRELPTEVISVILQYTDAQTLGRVECVSKRFHEPATSAWKDVYFTTFPLFVYATKDPHTTWKQHFKDTTAGSVTSHVQLYDFSIYNMNAKDYSVWLSADGYSGHFISPNGFARATEPVDPKMCRVVPEDIRNLNPHDLYVPPNVTCWSEYVKPGDEIELQWGNIVTYWWRGVVEKVEGEELHLIFTHFHKSSQFYRECAIFGRRNGNCRGVRKVVEPEISAMWRYGYELSNLRLLPAAEDDDTGV